MNEPVARVLSGYKEIASFLGVSTKTIQRHLKSIPVSRLGKKIMILEIDSMTWVQKRSRPNRSRKRYRNK
jgi:transcriptional antiterminator